LKTYKLTIPFYASLKTSAIIIAFISCAHASAQDTVKRLYFEKIRWTVEVPTEFKMLDSVTVEAQAREGGDTSLKRIAVNWIIQRSSISSLLQKLPLMPFQSP
jgi:hypothetical protein